MEMISIPKRSELHRVSKLYKIFEHAKRIIVPMPGVQATKVNLYKDRQWSQGSAWMLLEEKEDEKRLSLAIEKATTSCTVLHFGNLADIATAILSADTYSTKRIDSAVEAASKNPAHFPVGVLQREGITVEGPFGNFGERFEASFSLQELRRFVCDAMGGDTSCAESSSEARGRRGPPPTEARIRAWREARQAGHGMAVRCATPPDSVHYSARLLASTASLGTASAEVEEYL